jgi:hypothetical protein
MKQILWERKANIKLEFELGDGTLGAIDTASLVQSSILKLLNHVVAIVKLISPTVCSFQVLGHNPGTSYMVYDVWLV